MPRLSEKTWVPILYKIIEHAEVQTLLAMVAKSDQPRECLQILRDHYMNTSGWLGFVNDLARFMERTDKPGTFAGIAAQEIWADMFTCRNTTFVLRVDEKHPQDLEYLMRANINPASPLFGTLNEVLAWKKRVREMENEVATKLRQAHLPKSASAAVA